MRKLFIFLFLVSLCVESFAQTPQKMSYLAIARSSNNQTIRDETIGVRISILQGLGGGTEVFKETHRPVTDRNGVISLMIGDGTSEFGVFANIDWGNGPYFLKSEIDPDGGTNYTIEGTTQLLTVPFAEYATTAEKLSNGEEDPIFQASLARGITIADTVRWNDQSQQLDSMDVADFGFVAGSHTVDTQIDSTGIARLGFIAGPKTIDTRVDSTEVASMGFVAGPHTIDTQLDSAGIAGLGFVAGPKTIDTRIDSTGIAGLGYVAGPKTIDTKLDSLGIAYFGYVAGNHTVDTLIDSAGIAGFGYVAGPKTIDTQIDSAGIAALGFVANPQLTSFTETDPVFSASPAGTITLEDLTRWNSAGTGGQDNDSSDEIQVLSYEDGVLTLSKDGGSVRINIALTTLWVPAPTRGSGSNYHLNPCQVACPSGYVAAADSKGITCAAPNGSLGRDVSVASDKYLCGNHRLSQCHCVKIN